MAIVTIFRGRRFRVEAWGDEDHCSLNDFLQDLEKINYKEFRKIMALVQFSANEGPPRNEEKCRNLEGDHAEGLFEFKTPGGVRILWFYDKGSLIVCTHGFMKKRQETPLEEIRRAQGIRQRYLQSKNKIAIH